MPAIEELPQKTPTDQLYFSEIDGSSPFSTLSSPSSYSMSPPPQSTSRAVSPTKELTPLKKRRMDSTLYADDLSSTPSSLSSLSPNQSRQSTPDHEPHSTVPIVPPSSGRQNDEQAQRRHGSDHQPLHEHTNSPASLEMELFGLPAADKEKARANQVKDRSTIATRPSSKPGATKSISKKHSDSESDDGSFQNALGSLRKSSNNPETLPKKANGHSVVAPKSGQKTTPSSRRHLVIINTKTGSVTAHTGSGSSSTVSKVRNGSLGNSNGASKRPTVQAHTSTNGAGPRRMSILHSEQIVASAHGRYKNHFHMVVEDSDSTVASNPSSTSGDTMHTSLEYPGKDAREKFTLMKPFLSRSKLESDDKDEYNPIEDLVQTVRVIMEQFFSPEQRDKLFGTADEGLYRNLTKYKVRKDGIQFMKAVDEYNRIMRQEKTSGNIERFLKSYGRKLPYDLVVHILQQVYSRTVASRASRLNQYEAFSNNVYGEILPILTREFIRRTKLDHSKVFVDLGCGIGNVVLQVALQTGAESHGVEIMDTPAKFAKKQAKEFEARTQAYGLAHGSVNMIHGDFLETSELAAILARADVVLVNNYAFDSALNQSLLQLFLDLKDGAKVISLKTFVSLDHKINVRNAGSVESILRVRKYPYYTNAVSWTHNGGEYFIATVDRSAVQSFWESRM
ncbi:Nucleosomal histone H3-Lys79 methylase [Lunasporangiospora selenospora]|uniref:Histone-lysine N-methyltransferase, H3 lysine-79 specific n=1 Tax=Lunasporangiospora selenospora TaxID=979761 RepID=A0A9P6FUQ8_9FUNG|nr:Nucleosomal histone H3-Lys79 methylase [Lunasporangiospora selenospora]